MGRKEEMFYLTTHSTYFIYGYMVSNIWSRTTQITRNNTHCHHYISYSFWFAVMDLLYEPSHRQDSIYHDHDSCGALARTRNSSMGPPWGNALPQSYISLPNFMCYAFQSAAVFYRPGSTQHSRRYTSCGALAGMISLEVFVQFVWFVLVSLYLCCIDT